MAKNYCSKKHSEEDVKYAKQRLLDLCPRGTTIYGFTTKVSGTSTPRYELACIAIVDDNNKTVLHNITSWVHIFTGWRYYESGWDTCGIQQKGMYLEDMVQALALKLYDDSNALVALGK